MAESNLAQPDGSTLARLQAGDVAALAAVFELYGLRVLRLARRMLGNQSDAEDAAQEIFLRVFEQAGKFHGRSQFSTWLYRLAVRHCLNKIKQRERRSVAESAASPHAEWQRTTSAGSPAEHLVRRDELADADGLLATLPPDYRVCIVLREIEELPYARIAELLEIPIGTVMSRLARARQMLTDRLTEPPEKPATPREYPG